MRSLERSPDSESPCFFISEKCRKTVEAQVQHICRIVDMTVCYNTKIAIQTYWSSGGTSDSVVIVWWTSQCDAKTGACVQWLDCSHEVSGFFRIVPESRVSVGQNKSTLGAHQLATCWENPGRVQYRTGGRRSRKFGRSTRPPTQMQPQAQTARTQQVRSATRMSSCFRSDPECRDVDASAPCQSRLTDSKANDVVQLPVTDVQNEPMDTPFADVTSVLSQVRCFAYATQLFHRLTRRRSQRSPRSSFQTPWVSYMVSVTLQFARQPSDGFFKQWVVHAFPIHESLCSILVCCETHNVLHGGRAADKVAPNGSVARTIVAAKPSLAKEAKEVYDTSFQSISTSFVLSRDRGFVEAMSTASDISSIGPVRCCILLWWRFGWTLSRSSSSAASARFAESVALVWTGIASRVWT